MEKEQLLSIRTPTIEDNEDFNYHLLFVEEMKKPINLPCARIFNLLCPFRGVVHSQIGCTDFKSEKTLDLLDFFQIFSGFLDFFRIFQIFRIFSDFSDFFRFFGFFRIF